MRLGLGLRDQPEHRPGEGRDCGLERGRGEEGIEFEIRGMPVRAGTAPWTRTVRAVGMRRRRMRVPVEGLLPVLVRPRHVDVCRAHGRTQRMRDADTDAG